MMVETMTTSSERRNAALSMAVFAALCGQCALAQDAAESPGNRAGSSEAPAVSVLEQVVVTARKREESLQDVPVSLTAIGSEQLEKERVEGLSEIGQLAPSISWVQEQPGRGQLVMRGLSAGGIPNDRPTARQGVGLYLDEVPLGTTLRIPDLKAVDLARVEVLRGPQGTLYGAGAMGGAIRLVSNRPELDRFRASASAEVGFIEGGSASKAFSGVVNLPVVEDTFGLRLVGYRDSLGGWTRNLALGIDDANESENVGGRLSALWQASDALTITARLIVQDLENAPGTSRMIVSPFVPGPVPGFDESHARIAESHRDEIAIVNLEVGYDFGGAQLLMSASYQDRKADTLVDLTDLQLLYVGVEDVVSSFYEFTTYEDSVYEVRLASSGEGRLEWLVGAFYDQLEHTYDSTVPTPGFDAAYGAPITGTLGSTDDLFESWNTVDETQVALFAEATYDLNDHWKVTAGLRWFEQKQDFSLLARGLLNGGVTGGSQTFKESDVNPKFMISYEPDDDLLFAAQVVRGFKLGGANDEVPAAPCGADLAQLGLSDVPAGFESEYAWNYELLAKASFFGGRLVVNPSLFFMEYSNLQVPVTLASCGFKVYVNGDSAVSRGAELEVHANPFTGLDLRLGGSYTDAKLTSDLPLGVGYDGDRLPFAPKWQGSATARYSWDVGALTAYAQAGLRYRDETIQTLGWQRMTYAGRPTDSSLQSSVRFGLEADRWDAAVMVENAGNERVSTWTRETAFYSVHSVNQPRTVWVLANFHFD